MPPADAADRKPTNRCIGVAHPADLDDGKALAEIRISQTWARSRSRRMQAHRHSDSPASRRIDPANQPVDHYHRTYS